MGHRNLQFLQRVSKFYPLITEFLGPWPEKELETVWMHVDVRNSEKFANQYLNK